MTASPRLLVPALLLGLGLAAGCSSTPDTAVRSGSTPGSTSGSTAPAPRGATAPSATSTPPAEPSASPATDGAGKPRPQSTNAYVARCGATGEVRARLEALSTRLRAVGDPESGSRLPIAVAGTGDTAIVVLHGRNGSSCNAQDFLATVGGDKRFRVLAVDLCTSAAARCVGELALDDAAVTGLVLDWVRGRYQPDKVVVLGVGLGGATAVRAAAIGLPADSVVNVSGRAFADDVRRVTVPMLHVHEDLDAPAAAGALRAANEGVRRVQLRSAAASGWTALVDDLRLTDTGRSALSFAAR